MFFDIKNKKQINNLIKYEPVIIKHPKMMKSIDDSWINIFFLVNFLIRIQLYFLS